MKLSAKQVEHHAKPGKLSDGNGLSLLTKPTGSKSWVVRVTLPSGKRQDIGLGGYPTIGLAKARQFAAAKRAEHEAPAPVAREASRLPTFGELARQVFEGHVDSGHIGNGVYAASWLRSLELHAGPIMGKSVDEITTADVLDVLRPIWTAKHPTARKVRHRISEVMQTAMVLYEGMVTADPAGEHVKRGLPKGTRCNGHHEAIGYGELPEALIELDSAPASMASVLCLRFIALTAVRSGEARGARWAEIDIEAAEWRIPAARMKARREHRVPLSRPALDVLEAARLLDDGTGLVFPSDKGTGRPITPQSLARVWQTVHASTVHGLRSAFRTWALEATLTPWAVAEAALAHQIGNSVEAAYVRSDAMEQRRSLMAEWGHYCCADRA